MPTIIHTGPTIKAQPALILRQICAHDLDWMQTPDGRLRERCRSTVPEACGVTTGSPVDDNPASHREDGDDDGRARLDRQRVVESRVSPAGHRSGGETWRAVASADP